MLAIPDTTMHVFPSPTATCVCVCERESLRESKDEDREGRVRCERKKDQG